MSINISAKTDYSFLFSNMSSGSSTADNSISSLLIDYSNIKSGSYGKLMRAYYSKDNDTVSKLVDNSKSQSKDDDKTIGAIKSSSSKLYASTEALLETGSKSVFAEKEITVKDENGLETTTKGYDTDAIYKSVKAFTDDYNNMLEEGSNSNNSKILNSLKNMISSTKVQEKMLSAVGITIEDDDTLSVDEATFKKADMTKVKSLFQGTGSYGYGINTKASFINMYAANDAKAASGLYGSSADYLSSYNRTGNIYSSFI